MPPLPVLQIVGGLELACTAGKPQELTELSGEIGSPTLYDTDNYPSNSNSLWKISIPEWMASTDINVLHVLIFSHKFKHCALCISFNQC